MFAYINGKITYKSPTQLYVECNGVGYLINISLQTYSEIETINEVKLYTQLIIREDAHTLFGFISEEEKNMFNYLLSVSGIGPNTARLMLSSLSTAELVQAIISEDVRLIQSVKGVGPKSAQRVIIELKDKVRKDSLTPTQITTTNTHSNILNEAILALNMLGFAKPQAEKAVQKAIQQNTSVGSVEDLIKLALKNL